MKDYYEILGVTPKSTEEEIRKSYRKLAMQYHPDRNPDDPQAEENFKAVAEAYGVLTDPAKKREYDSCRAAGTNYGHSSVRGEGFSYSQEDILKDLFKDPRFQQMFTGLLREFQRSGFRHSSKFIRKSFFGAKGGIFISGIFLVGSLAGPLLTGAARKGLTNKGAVLKSVGNSVGKLLGFGKTTEANEESPPEPQLHKDLDITYHTPLSVAELEHGKVIQVLVHADQGEQTLKVTIPPGSKKGQRLRIKGKGRPAPLGSSPKSQPRSRGDLYLQLTEKV